jgi:protein SCO1/2
MTKAVVALAVAVVAFGCLAWASRAEPSCLTVRDTVPVAVRHAGLPYYDDVGFTASWDRAPHHVIAPFRLFDQRGQAFTEKNLDGHVSVLGFFSPGCSGVCTTTVANERRLARLPIQIVSIAVTPETTQTLQAYARVHGVGWHLLNGDAVTVQRLQQDDCFAAPYGDQGGPAQHTETLVLVDAQRHLRGVYRGTSPFDIERVAHDLAALSH